MTHSSPLTEPLPAVEPVDLIAAAVLATPVVTGLHGGRSGEVATYLTEVDTAVRTALAPVLPARTVVSIVIEDVQAHVN